MLPKPSNQTKSSFAWHKKPQKKHITMICLFYFSRLKFNYYDKLTH